MSTWAWAPRIGEKVERGSSLLGRRAEKARAEALQTLFADATSRKTAEAVERLRAEKAARAEKARADGQARAGKGAAPAPAPGKDDEVATLALLLAQGSITKGAFDAAVARLKA